jgi:hypothetical protein
MTIELAQVLVPFRAEGPLPYQPGPTARVGMRLETEGFYETAV